MAGDGWNVLSSFQEMGTFSKVMLLLGFLFVGAVLARGASLSDRLLPVSLALISLSLAVHYLSKGRTTVTDGSHSIVSFDWGKSWSGIAMVVITVGLVVWAALVPFQKPADAAKKADVSTLQKEIVPAEKPAAPPKGVVASHKPPGQLPSQDNSVHVESGSKVEQQSNAPCSPNIIGGSNTVTCTAPVVSSILVKATTVCDLENGSPPPDLSDTSFMELSGPSTVTLSGPGATVVLQAVSPYSTKNLGNGKVLVTDKYALPASSEILGRPVSSLSAISAISLRMVGMGMNWCAAFHGMDVEASVNGMMVWREGFPGGAARKPSENGAPGISGPIHNWDQGLKTAMKLE